jgi:peroxiredoxin Q/BCP
VIYFYPKDDTPGCTREACTFRDQFEDFQDVGATVFGISADSPKSHLRFKERHNLPFSLLSDRHNKVRKQLGIKSSFLGLLPGRVTFVIGNDGKVIHKFTSQFNAEKHVREAIKAIREN